MSPASQKARQSEWLKAARQTVQVEINGLEALSASFDDGLSQSFVQAIDMILQASGRVIVSGVGKSGHIGRKIAATLASTGTPALFVHATDASHGDLGMITADDVLIVLSNSGETSELRDLVGYSRRFRVPLIAVTSNLKSALATAADITLPLPAAEEAGPIGLAPTTSATMQMVIGDALTVALLEDKGFSAQDFREFHPGGRLGAALMRAGDIMHPRSMLPLCAETTLVSEALITMSQKSFGCVGVENTSGELTGIVTDGDLRRHMAGDLLQLPVRQIMTVAPKTITQETLVSSALEVMNSANITSLFVVRHRQAVGLVHVHDLLRIGVR